MVLINKRERDAIVASFPKIHIMRTMRGDSKRHHYYCTEIPAAMRLLASMRKGTV